MPDLSLFNPICKELDITVNELMSGEKLEETNYQKKLEENIINVMINEKRKVKNKKRILIISVLIIILLYWLAAYVYNMELDVEYDERIMTCEFNDGTLIHYMKGSSVLNVKHIEKVIGNNKYYVFHNTITVKNKMHSNYEYKESFANYVFNGEMQYGITGWYDKEEEDYDNIFVYYSNSTLSKLSKMTDKEFKKNLTKLNKMCSLN